MLAVSSIKGGIKVAGQVPRPEPGKADQEREPVLAAK